MQKRFRHISKNWLTSGMSFIHEQGSNGTTSSISITPGIAPAEGDVLVVQIAHQTNLDTGAITPDTGFAVAISSATTKTGMWYKVATASEPGSYTFAVPSSTYGWELLILRGVDGTAPLTSLVALTHTTVPGTYTSSSFTIPFPGIAVTVLGKSTTTGWIPTGSGATWTLRTGSGQGKAGTAIYTDVGLSQTLTWALTAGGTTSTVISVAAFLFVCKRVKH